MNSMRTSNELQTGKAGEYLVCADLILKGFVAFPSEQGLPYDVVLDTGERVLRVQVKTTNAPRVIPQRAKDSVAYIFNIKRAGKRGRGGYVDGDFDLYALVCLDTKKIGYLLYGEMPSTINIRVDSLRGKYHDEKGVSDYQKVLSLSHLPRKEIAGICGLQLATVYKMLKPGFKPFQTGARYFSDFERERDWFLHIGRKEGRLFE